MDLDEELSFLSDDKIQKFLVSKLEEITEQNEALEAVLEERKKEIEELRKKSSQEIQLKHLWKNSINHKLIIGFEVICPGTFSNIQVILGNLPETESFNYITQTYSLNNNLALSENNCSLIPGYLNRAEIFENKALVTISFDMPCYTHKTEYTIKGHVVCTDVDNNEEIITSILETQISFEDSSIKQYKLDGLQILLSSVASCMETVLLMLFPEEWSIPLISTFEINCLLTYTAINDETGYFIANKISENFNGTIMIPQYPSSDKTVVFLQVYTSCDKQLFAFLHHLLSRVQNSVILPQIFSHIIDDDGNKNESCSYEEKTIILDKFKENMLKEISLGRTSCKWLKPEMFNLQDTRKKLLQQETETDLNYLKLIRM